MTRSSVAVPGGDYLVNGTSLCQAAGDREETNLLNLGGVRGLQP